MVSTKRMDGLKMAASIELTKLGFVTNWDSYMRNVCGLCAVCHKCDLRSTAPTVCPVPRFAAAGGRRGQLTASQNPSHRRANALALALASGACP